MDMRTKVSIRTAALVATVGLAAMAAYQLSLAARAPFGEAAWGGIHEGQLPTSFRIGSSVGAPRPGGWLRPTSHP
jgi:hypothetical protein